MWFPFFNVHRTVKPHNFTNDCSIHHFEWLFSFKYCSDFFPLAFTSTFFSSLSSNHLFYQSIYLCFLFRSFFLSYHNWFSYLRLSPLVFQALHKFLCSLLGNHLFSISIFHTMIMVRRDGGSVLMGVLPHNHAKGWKRTILR